MRWCGNLQAATTLQAGCSIVLVTGCSRRNKKVNKVVQEFPDPLSAVRMQGNLPGEQSLAPSSWRMAVARSRAESAAID